MFSTHAYDLVGFSTKHQQGVGVWWFGGLVVWWVGWLVGGWVGGGGGGVGVAIVMRCM